MNNRAINELAAILVHDHGSAALRWARQRQAWYAHDPESELFRLWASIARAAARQLREQAGKAAAANPSR